MSRYLGDIPKLVLHNCLLYLLLTCKVSLESDTLNWIELLLYWLPAGYQSEKRVLTSHGITMCVYAVGSIQSHVSSSRQTRARLPLDGVRLEFRAQAAPMHLHSKHRQKTHFSPSNSSPLYMGKGSDWLLLPMAWWVLYFGWWGNGP